MKPNQEYKNDYNDPYHIRVKARTNRIFIRASAKTLEEATSISRNIIDNNTSTRTVKIYSSKKNDWVCVNTITKDLKNRK